MGTGVRFEGSQVVLRASRDYSPLSRKERAITFHSWRYFLNSVSRGRVSDEKLRLMTGHHNKEMSEHYTHLLDEDYTEMRKVQEDVFGVIKLKMFDRITFRQKHVAGGRRWPFYTYYKNLRLKCYGD